MADRLHHLGQLRRCRLRPDERGRRPVHQLPVHPAYAADRCPADRLSEGAHDAARVAARYQLRGYEDASLRWALSSNVTGDDAAAAAATKAREDYAKMQYYEMFRDGKNVYTEHFQTEANETDPNLAPGTTKIK